MALGAGAHVGIFWSVAGSDEADKAGRVEHGKWSMPVRLIQLSPTAGDSGAARDGEVGFCVAAATPNPRVRR